MTAAVDGSDAVIVALGAGRAAGVRETGTRTAVEAMRATGVRRLVCLSTLGAGESRANLNFVWKYLMFGLLLRAAYADHQRQEEVVRGSGLDWTLIRPSAYTDGPRTGDYRHGFGPDATGLTLKVARADVADALLRAVTDRAQVGRAVAVSH
ncbi:NAD-dependent epimerase/dehydratase [Mycobacteroides abscessus subsp. abscessus]|nr:NAD-dependent epimerase/dehydratase [Mycobacteroides abscessus subsp. abscessus]